MLEDADTRAFINRRQGYSVHSETSAPSTSSLPHPPGQPDAPPCAVASRRKDLRGLPPRWIATSDIDLLFEEANICCQRLRASDVACSLYVVPQAPHGFEALVPRSRLAIELLRENRAFLRERMSLT